MNCFNLNINELAIKLKQEVENNFVKEYKNIEKDEEGQIIIPSLENIIEDTITKYFEDYYNSDVLENVQEEFNEVYNKLYEEITKAVDEQELLESMLPIPNDYYMG